MTRQSDPIEYQEYLQRKRKMKPTNKRLSLEEKWKKKVRALVKRWKK